MKNTLGRPVLYDKPLTGENIFKRSIIGKEDNTTSSLQILQQTISITDENIGGSGGIESGDVEDLTSRTLTVEDIFSIDDKFILSSEIATYATDNEQGFKKSIADNFNNTVAGTPLYKNSLLFNVPYKYSYEQYQNYDYVHPDINNFSRGNDVRESWLYLYDTKVKITGPITNIKSDFATFRSKIPVLGYIDREDYEKDSSILLRDGNQDTSETLRGFGFEYSKDTGNNNNNIKLLKGFMGFNPKNGRFVFYKNCDYNKTQDTATRITGVKNEFELDEIYTSSLTSLPESGTSDIIISSSAKLDLYSTTNLSLNSTNGKTQLKSKVLVLYNSSTQEPTVSNGSIGIKATNNVDIISGANTGKVILTISNNGVQFTKTATEPLTGSYSIGTSSKRFKDIYSNNAAIGNLLEDIDVNSNNIRNVKIVSGSINNTSIGDTTRSTGKFTTANASTLVISDREDTVDSSNYSILVKKGIVRFYNSGLEGSLEWNSGLTLKDTNLTLVNGTKNKFIWDHFYDKLNTVGVSVNLTNSSSLNLTGSNINVDTNKITYTSSSNTLTANSIIMDIIDTGIIIKKGTDDRIVYNPTKNDLIKVLNTSLTVSDTTTLFSGGSVSSENTKFSLVGDGSIPLDIKSFVVSVMDDSDNNLFQINTNSRHVTLTETDTIFNGVNTNSKNVASKLIVNKYDVIFSDTNITIKEGTTENIMYNSDGLIVNDTPSVFTSSPITFNQGDFKIQQTSGDDRISYTYTSNTLDINNLSNINLSNSDILVTGDSINGNNITTSYTNFTINGINTGATIYNYSSNKTSIETGSLLLNNSILKIQDSGVDKVSYENGILTLSTSTLKLEDTGIQVKSGAMMLFDITTNPNNNTGTVTFKDSDIQLVSGTSNIVNIDMQSNKISLSSVSLVLNDTPLNIQKSGNNRIVYSNNSNVFSISNVTKMKLTNTPLSVFDSSETSVKFLDIDPEKRIIITDASIKIKDSANIDRITYKQKELYINGLMLASIKDTPIEVYNGTKKLIGIDTTNTNVDVSGVTTTFTKGKIVFNDTDFKLQKDGVDKIKYSTNNLILRKVELAKLQDTPVVFSKHNSLTEEEIFIDIIPSDKKVTFTDVQLSMSKGTNTFLDIESSNKYITITGSTTLVENGSTILKNTDLILENTSLILEDSSGNNKIVYNTSGGLNIFNLTFTKLTNTPLRIFDSSETPVKFLDIDPSRSVTFTDAIIRVADAYNVFLEVLPSTSNTLNTVKFTDAVVEMYNSNNVEFLSIDTSINQINFTDTIYNITRGKTIINNSLIKVQDDGSDRIDYASSTLTTTNLRFISNKKDSSDNITNLIDLDTINKKLYVSNLETSITNGRITFNDTDLKLQVGDVDKVAFTHTDNTISISDITTVDFTNSPIKMYETNVLFYEISPSTKTFTFTSSSINIKDSTSNFLEINPSRKITVTDASLTTNDTNIVFNINDTKSFDIASTVDTNTQGSFNVINSFFVVRNGESNRINYDISGDTLQFTKLQDTIFQNTPIKYKSNTTTFYSVSSENKEIDISDLNKYSISSKENEISSFLKDQKHIEKVKGVIGKENTLTKTVRYTLQVENLDPSPDDEGTDNYMFVSVNSTDLDNDYNYIPYDSIGTHVIRGTVICEVKENKTDDNTDNIVKNNVVFDVMVIIKGDTVIHDGTTKMYSETLGTFTLEFSLSESESIINVNANYKRLPNAISVKDLRCYGDLRIVYM